jgi:RNA polymerase sigma-70 factor (ECF subfamily)
LKHNHDISSLSDLELVSLYRETGDKELVGELFRRYTRFVFLVSLNYLDDEEKAKDAAMQVFENLFTGLRKHDIRNFKSWLHVVTKNHSLMQLRGQKQQQIIREEWQKVYAEDMESPLFLNPYDEKEESLIDLEEAILMLSKEQRICIELFYLKKKSYNEIVEITGDSYLQVKSHIQNGKRNLKILLTKQNER